VSHSCFLVLNPARSVPRRAAKASASLRRSVSHRREEASLAAERAHPGELGEKPLEGPIVLRLREQIAGLSSKKSARVRAKVHDSPLPEPGSDLAQRVAVLLHVPVLVPKPRLAASGLPAPVAQHRVPRDPPEPRQPRDRPAQPQGKPR